MAELPSFEAYFRAVHGYDPFPWQSRLASDVLSRAASELNGAERDPWPALLDVPTGAGKTSALDVAVYTLACAPGRLPRRVLLVVDRRIVVDQAGDHAERIATSLAQATDGPLRAIADALRALWGAPSEEPPVAVARLRGGMPRDNDWARRPDQPVLGVSTVDQVGSRLLFRGYGVSPRSASIHAGLVGNDTLVLLDEVHLAEPFAQTLEAIDAQRRRSPSSLPERRATVRMSATPGRASRDVHSLSAADHAHPVLARRLAAAKRARLALVRVTGDDEAKKLEVVAKAAVENALRLQADGAKVVGVVLNRVDSARHARRLLEAHPSTDALLVTGRMRPIDRDQLVREELLRRCGARNERRSGFRPLVVVATQCIEAGADLDFDGLVTECASLDALRQRFGRLDRQGAVGQTHAVILGRSDHVERKRDEPIYGDALAATWAWLGTQASDGSVGFGINELPQALAVDGTPRTDLLAPRPDAPVLLPAHLDAWAQTSPAPAYDPDVALWLHGPDKPAADVQVLWRADITLPSETTDDGAHLDAAIALLGASRPSTLETVTVPLHAARRWLGGKGAAPIADVMGGDAEEEAEPRRGQPIDTTPVALRWRGDDSEWVPANDLRPGDILVVPASIGGLRHGSFDPDAVDEVTDVGTLAALRSRGVLALRLGGAGLAALGVDQDAVRSLPKPAAEETTRDWRARLREWGEGLPREHDASAPATAAEYARFRDSVADRRAGDLTRIAEGSTTEHCVWQRPLQRASKANRFVSLTGESVTEDDASPFTGSAVSLARHSGDVRDVAFQFAKSVGLPESIATDLRLAAWLHDVGKADPRFQRWMVGGGSHSGALLAKSLLPPGSVAERELARTRAGYPRGYRHELLSLAMVESNTTLLAGANDPDLVLHLVASHHGHCRPFAPFEDHPDDLTVEVQHGEQTLRAGTRHRRARLDSGVADRFWRLVDRYGWWGLAWLEAILRLADHRASEAEVTGD